MMCRDLGDEHTMALLGRHTRPENRFPSTLFSAVDFDTDERPIFVTWFFFETFSRQFVDGNADNQYTCNIPIAQKWQHISNTWVYCVDKQWLWTNCRHICDSWYRESVACLGSSLDTYSSAVYCNLQGSKIASLHPV